MGKHRGARHPTLVITSDLKLPETPSMVPERNNPAEPYSTQGIVRHDKMVIVLSLFVLGWSFYSAIANQNSTYCCR